MIEVKNLVKDYGGHVAVDHLNFTIEDGQIYGFLGPNGAGKSTTMNIMTGYIGATQGDVVINGHNILEEPEEAKKCIGYLPELPPLYVEMTVDEQLEFAAQLKQIPKKDRPGAIQEVVDLAKIDDVRGRLIRNLSKGYKQRVGLAQAVLGMPPVIVLDEPTVGLDPKQIIEIRDTIRELGRKHTVILSSHILSEVSAVCDHIMIIHRGKLIASDTPENLERQMAGERSMELLAKGTMEEIEAILEEVSQAGKPQVTATDEDGVYKIILKMEQEEGEGKADIRETIFFAFADHRCPILSMATSRASLEEVFLELTADGKEASSQDQLKEADDLEEDGLEEAPALEDGLEEAAGQEESGQQGQEEQEEVADHGSHL